MRRDAGWLLTAAAAAAVSATTAGAGGRVSLIPLLRAGQEHAGRLERGAARALPVDADEERRLGERLAGAMPGAVPDAGLEALGRRLERTGLASRYAGRFEYRLIPGGTANAHAAPGGFVFVGQALGPLLEDDPARVSFVVAHELAHAELGHTADLVRYRTWADRFLPPLGDAAQALRALPALAYSETQELEADALALEMLRRADLRPAAALEALERLLPQEWDPDGLLLQPLLDYPRTHPGRRERLERMRQRLSLGPS